MPAPGPSGRAATDAAPAVRRAELATHLAFAGAGFAFASFASRIPQVRDALGLSSAELGLVLLAIAAGSVLALPLSGVVVTRFGSRHTVRTMAVVMACGLLVAATGSTTGVPLLVAGLFLVGFGNGAWDVAMNVQGAVVERHLARSVMSRFHAGYSLGTVAGALVGVAMVALGVPVPAHLAAVALLVGSAVPAGTRAFLPDEPVEAAADAGPAGHRTVLLAWRERRTLLVGLFVLAFAFAEGAGNDWIGVAVIDDYGLSPAWGTLALACFLTTMTAGRWFGPALLDRYGRVPVVRALAVLAVVGSLLFVLGDHPAAAYAGVLLWGLGTSLGFPVGMSAAADDPVRAAGRVSVVASIGYCAFLAGPPLLGALGDAVTVQRALIAVAVLLGVAALVSATVREPAPGG